MIIGPLRSILIRSLGKLFSGSVIVVLKTTCTYYYVLATTIYIYSASKYIYRYTGKYINIIYIRTCICIINMIWQYIYTCYSSNHKD